MNFLRWDLAPGLIFAIVTLVFVVLFVEKRFFKLVKTYWFYGRSPLSYVSSILFLSGMGLLTLSLLDARGPDEKIKTAAPTERTIILIDTSASMLSEDVKPSRLQKAVLIAKHFARKAAGQQVAVVVFAEIQKKIVPFTNDLDLIDARLDTIKNLKNNYGSSALSVAIQESIQYFREAGNETRGNLLVLTDGEETADGVKLNVPKDVNVAFVGVGTEQGGRIPMDDGRGLRYGYKKSGGKDVITKLSEQFFENTVADIPSAKFWTANSYSLPSEEILEFFRREMKKGENEQDMVIRPVLMEWIVIPALLLILGSYFLKALRVFTLGLLLIIGPVWSQEPVTEEKEGPQLSQETISKLDDLQQGRLSRLEKIKLADELQKSGALDESLQLYRENLPLDQIDKSLPPEAYLNFGTGLLKKEKTSDGLKIYDQLARALDEGPEADKIKKTMAQNALSHFQKKEEKKKKEEKDKEKEKKDQGKEKKDNKDQNQNGNSQENQNNKDNSDSGKSDQKKQQSGKEPPKDQKENKDQGEEKKDEKETGEDEKDDPEKKDGSPKEPDTKKPLPPKKMPAKLKQLLSDDRQLQMKVIENGTRDLNKKRSRTSKDW